MSTEKVPYVFNPDIRYPIYLVRNGIYKAVKKYSSHLYGVMMDFGCGSKPYKSLFKVAEYVGVDIYNSGHKHEGEPIDVFYDGKVIPFPDNHFDAVFSTEVFEHVFNLEDILKELNRVMKSGAKMLFTCPFVYPEHEEPYDFARYTVFALNQLLDKNGFKVISIEKTGNSIQAITQLQIINLVSYKTKIRFLDAIFWRIITVPLNLSAILLGGILPQRKNLYLNNVILCEKR